VTRGNSHGSLGIPVEMGMNDPFCWECDWEWKRYFGNGKKWE